MNLTQNQRVGIFALLALVMAATRINHFAPVPDASWALFLLGGFYLRGAARWAFPLLMAEAVLIDYIVISGQGINFWSHYCVSAAYWFLIAAYGAMWFGGVLMRRAGIGFNWRSLGIAAATLVASTAACHLIAQGSFYWLSDSVASPSLGGWAANYADWYLPYLRTTALYVAIAAVLHALAVQLARALPQRRRAH